MKLFITNKKRIFIALALIIAIIGGIVTIGYCKTVETAKQNNGLPIYCVETSKKQVAISFDAAWGNEDTEELINILKKYDVKATFFLVGSWVTKYPESVKQLADAGHSIQNHSNTHPYLSSLSSADISAEIQACNDKVKKITGVAPILIRPPYGYYNDSVVTTIESMNMFTIQWSIDSLDWQDISADEIYNNVTKNVKNGDIILFHNAAKHTPEALPRILEKLQKDGFEIVLIKDMIYKDNYSIDVAGKQIPKI